MNMLQFVEKINYIQSGQTYKEMFKVFLSYQECTNTSELPSYSLFQLYYKIYRVLPPPSNIKAELNQMDS